MHTKQAAYRTYVIGVPVPVDSIPTALYWDTEDSIFAGTGIPLVGTNHGHHRRFGIHRGPSW
jgi:hypothetical protein